MGSRSVRLARTICSPTSICRPTYWLQRAASAAVLQLTANLYSRNPSQLPLDVGAADTAQVAQHDGHGSV
ncbi:hypothetical protein pipiens_013463 [Culex pipiens pipiens]|uniref:Uncharacterized protein n=1 Tax=Culex pipiens pipiens TaxID=38569 RepID=A0ABD1CYG1_CULPP